MRRPPSRHPAAMNRGRHARRRIANLVCLALVLATATVACKKKADGEVCRTNADCDAELVCMTQIFMKDHPANMCVPLKAGRAPACAAAIWCVEGGQCSLVPGNGTTDTAGCVAANDADCATAGDCKKKGQCRA